MCKHKLQCTLIVHILWNVIACKQLRTKISRKLSNTPQTNSCTFKVNGRLFVPWSSWLIFENWVDTVLGGKWAGKFEDWVTLGVLISVFVWPQGSTLPFWLLSVEVIVVLELFNGELDGTSVLSRFDVEGILAATGALLSVLGDYCIMVIMGIGWKEECNYIVFG